MSLPLCIPYSDSLLLRRREIGAIGPLVGQTWYQFQHLRRLALVTNRRLLHGDLPSAEPPAGGDPTVVAPHIAATGSSSGGGAHTWVSSLAIERIESRYLLAGSGNGSLHLYDLDEGVGDDPHSSGSGGGGGLSSAPPTAPRTITPLGEIPRPAGHAYTVSDVHWYPFDTGLFTTSSFDTTLKVWDTSALQAACTFHLQDKVLSHTLSSVAPGTNPYAHCLIAAATTNPLVRLCDLQSGAFTQTLTGHVGPVISCQWSPRHAHLLATGGTDGAVRLWDIRRASSCLMELNCRQSQSEYQLSQQPPPKRKATLGSKRTSRQMNTMSSRGRAHQGMVNGLNFTEDGFYLVTVGSDQCIRLWDAATGDLLPVDFEPQFHCRSQRKYDVVIPPLADAWPLPVFIPQTKFRDVHCWDIQSGQFIKRLEGAFREVISACWRVGHEELYAGGYDQEILVWAPELPGQKLVHQEAAQRDEWSDSD